MPTTPPPSPAAATDETAFIAELRRLKTWSGLSYRRLERRATAAGDTLPYSTAATMLSKNRLPREEVVAAFVTACGVPDARPWLVARARIADGTATTPVAPPRHVPRHVPLSRWRRAFTAAVAVAVAFTGGAVAATAGASDVDVEVVTR